MIKTLSLVGGLAGAMALSQYPEFSQQYLQRLAGQVDALTTVVVDFDQSALASGLGREEALQEMTGTAFLTDRQADMRQTFGRHARLSENLVLLQNASPIERLTLPHRMTDAPTIAATWSDFRPGLPLTLAGGLSAAAGFVLGWIAVGLIAAATAVGLSSLRWKGKAPKAQTAPTERRDPPVARPPRPTLVAETASHIPRLMGEVR